MRYLPIILSLLLCSCGDVVNNKYQTYQDAKEDRLFDRGWLPDLLPSSTTNIVTKNDLDLNTSNGHFKIPESDMHLFLDKLTPIEDGIFKYQDEGRKDWWVFTVNKNGYVSYTLKR